MSSPVGFLDFFILEASEYVERLDGLLAGASAPDADAVQRAARSLRGSATMAKLPAFAELAHALERTGRALRDGSASWDDRLRGATVSAVDDLKILLRNAREWGEADTRRASERTAELLGILPARTSTTPSAPPGASGTTFLAGEAGNIAAGLELLLTRPNDEAAAAMVLKRVRALRGVAAVKDLPLMAQVLEAAEQAGHPIESGRDTISPAQRELLHACVEALRGAAGALREGRPIDARGPTARRFGDALDTWLDSSGESERVVPIGSLFHDDAGPHVVSAAAAPPTTVTERFRLELVSQGEHLARLVDEARQAPDDAARERFRREVRRSLRAARALAESFDEREFASLTSEMMSASALDAPLLERLARVAKLMADPSLSREALHQRLAALDRAPEPARAAAPTPAPSSPAVPTAVVTAVAPTPPPTPATTSTPATPRQTAAVAHSGDVPTLTGAADLLEQGLAGLARLEREPLAMRTPTEPPIVPVETLIYRGRGAVRRAIEIRDAVRRTGSPPPMETIEELFDLLDLALLDEAAA
jgi:chemotaxis protein histidine kinase CheA